MRKIWVLCILPKRILELPPHRIKSTRAMSCETSLIELSLRRPRVFRGTAPQFVPLHPFTIGGFRAMKL